MPKVSVLMGIYNCEKTLDKSIQSIMEQTFSDWEFIICDDGSSDNSAEIVKKYTEIDKRIKLIKNERNRGLSYTLNHCIKESSGEYCARMDGDDLCNPLRFEKQVNFLDNHPEYGFVSTPMIRYDEKGIYNIPFLKQGYSPKLKEYIVSSPFCHAPAMIRRSSYDKVNGYRDINYVLGDEDYDLWFRLLAVGIKGYILNEPLYSMFDGRDADIRRTFKRRINEAKVRKDGYRLLNIPFYLRLYILKPIIIGCIPKFWYKIILKKRLNRCY